MIEQVASSVLVWRQAREQGYAVDRRGRVYGALTFTNVTPDRAVGADATGGILHEVPDNPLATARQCGKVTGDNDFANWGTGQMRNFAGTIILLIIATVPSATMAQMFGAQSTQAASSTSAQALTTLSADEQLELLSRLSDEQARALLAEYLKAGAADGSSSSTIELLEAQSERFQENFIAVLRSAPQLSHIPRLVYDRLTEGKSALHPFWVLVFLSIILAVGYGAERLFAHMPKGLRARLAAAEHDADFMGRFGRVAGLMLLDVLGLAVFTITALIFFLLVFEGHEPTRLVILTVLSATVLLRFVIVVSRATFGDGDEALRLVPVNQDDARSAHHYVIAAGAIGAFGFLGSDMLRRYGLDDDPRNLTRLIVGTLLTLTVLVGVWRVRRGIAGAILSQFGARGPGTDALQAIVGLWHVPVMIYLLVIYGMAVFSGYAGGVSGTGPGLWSILLIAILPLVDRVLCAAMDRYRGARSGAVDASHLILRRAAHIFVALIGVIVLAAIWKADVFDVAEAGVGGQIARAALDIALTGFIGYVAWGLLTAAVARHMPSQQEGEPGGDEGGGATTTRAGTVLPIFMRFAQVSIAVLVVMIALSALGVNIGPLLAGAGVIGIAVGFGAQTLVRDMVSGLFFLVDDAFRRGEYVDLGGITGTVERINLRSLVLRHHLGPQHTVPYGEIQRLTNFSRDWVIMKLEFRVSYDTDINKVKKIFKRIGQEMLDHPELGKDFIEPFKSQGVKAMEESAMIVRGKFMAKPGTQFTIRKELYTRIQQAFRENGIEFAHRRVKVDLPSDVELPSEKKRELAEAAAAAATAETERVRKKI